MAKALTKGYKNFYLLWSDTQVHAHNYAYKTGEHTVTCYICIHFNTYVNELVLVQPINIH